MRGLKTVLENFCNEKVKNLDLLLKSNADFPKTTHSYPIVQQKQYQTSSLQSFIETECENTRSGVLLDISLERLKNSPQIDSLNATCHELHEYAIACNKKADADLHKIEKSALNALKGFSCFLLAILVYNAASY